MLPDTITVNSGSPATDKVYSGIQRDGNHVSYSKDSPQGDLLGCYTLDVDAQKSKQGIVRSFEKWTFPYYDSTKAAYAGGCTINVTITRPDSLPVAFVDMSIETALKGSLQAAFKAALAAARH